MSSGFQLCLVALAFQVTISVISAAMAGGGLPRRMIDTVLGTGAWTLTAVMLTGATVTSLTCILCVVCKMIKNGKMLQRKE